MAEPKEHDILGAKESTEISYRQVLAEFEEDIYPGFKDKGIPLGIALMSYQLVCLENLMTEIRDLLQEKF